MKTKVTLSSKKVQSGSRNITVTTEKFKVNGIQLPIKSSVAGNSLYEIYKRNNNHLTPEVVLKNAKSENHPLHPCFEWNNKKAAEKFRLHQAGKLIRCITMVKQMGKEKIEVRAFVNIQEDAQGNLTHNPFNAKGKSYYISINDAMMNDFTKAYTVDTAVLELNRVMDKYKTVKKLSKLFQVIRTHIKKIK